MRRSTPPGPPRPSAKEAKKKLGDALVAVQAGQCQVALSKHSSLSLTFLGCDESELWDVVQVLLKELLALDNPGDAYAGGRPPQKSL